jgi:hypothetical protein
LVIKPFEKENELAQFKKDVSKLEREISIKIQENQMKQHNMVDENNIEIKETQVIKIEKSLLPKKVNTDRNAKGMSV